MTQKKLRKSIINNEFGYKNVYNINKFYCFATYFHTQLVAFVCDCYKCATLMLHNRRPDKLILVAGCWSPRLVPPSLSSVRIVFPVHTLGGSTESSMPMYFIWHFHTTSQPADILQWSICVHLQYNVALEM